jgi:hypothetical protein
VESDDSEDGQSISYYRNSFNNIIVTFLTPPHTTYPTLPSQPPLPKPCKVESDDGEDGSWGSWTGDPFQGSMMGGDAAGGPCEVELHGDEEDVIGMLLRGTSSSSSSGMVKDR